MNEMATLKKLVAGEQKRLPGWQGITPAEFVRGYSEALATMAQWLEDLAE